VPDFVAGALAALPGDGQWSFWDGKSDIVNTWARRRIPRFDRARSSRGFRALYRGR